MTGLGNNNTLETGLCLGAIGGTITIGCEMSVAGQSTVISGGVLIAVGGGMRIDACKYVSAGSGFDPSWRSGFGTLGGGLAVQLANDTEPFFLSQMENLARVRLGALLPLPVEPSSLDSHLHLVSNGGWPNHLFVSNRLLPSTSRAAGASSLENPPFAA